MTVPENDLAWQMLREALLDTDPAKAADWDPACWDWPVPDSCTFRDEEHASDFLRWWNHLCAICEARRNLVEDHTHKTGLVRGWLCQSCNLKEGHAGSDGVFAKYRQRNPASILGVKVRYCNLLYGYAEPPAPLPPGQRSGSVLSDRRRRVAAPAVVKAGDPE